MIQLKNCPNCGGILDDEGRCMYCKSKVYDLTGVNIDFNTRDVVLLKIKWQDQIVYLKAHPINAEIEMHSVYDDISNLCGSHPTRVYNRTDATCNMEFNVIEMENQNIGLEGSNGQ